jgi:hypothetical protein
MMSLVPLSLNLEQMMLVPVDLSVSRQEMPVTWVVTCQSPPVRQHWPEEMRNLLVGLDLGLVV